MTTRPTKQEICNLLSPMRFFQALRPVELEKIARHSIRKIFARGDVVFDAEDSADFVWLIVRGRVHIYRHTSGGRRLAIEILTKGEVFGIHCGCTVENGQYHCSAIAEEPTVVLSIPTKVFLDYLFKNPMLVREMWHWCSQKLKVALDMRCLSQESVGMRLAATLANLQQSFGDIIPLTKKELSEVIGATQETTFRTLSRFHRLGYIESLRGGIRILSLKGLKSLVPA